MTWLIIGAGVSGLGAAKWLVKQGERVRISEAQAIPKPKAKAFTSLAGVALYDGGHALDHLDGVTHVVPSPGLPPTHPLLVAAKERRLPVISEIDLALASVKVPVIAVTGTNGKSTTCAMIAHALGELGVKASLGGNFGDPPTALLAEDRLGDVLVLELSSYQLEQSHLVHPQAAIFTSFSFDHIARHGSIAAYFAAKWRLFAQMDQGNLAILPPDIVRLAASHGLSLPKATRRLFVVPPGHSEDDVPRGESFLAVQGERLVNEAKQTVDLSAMRLRQPHNLLNAAFAVAAIGHVTGHPADAILRALASFRGLAHRCELVGTLGGQSVVNDSKSTNVESTLVALASSTAPTLLLLGGQGKGESYAPLLLYQDRIAAVVAFGASADEIAAELDGKVKVHSYPKLADAIGELPSLSARYRAGILFSPAGASFDEFDNYLARGDYFRQAITAAVKLD